MHRTEIYEVYKVMNHTKLNTEYNMHNAIKANNYMIGSFTAAGGVSFAQYPAVQYNEMQARAECRRLAEMNKNKTYFYVRLCGAEKVITNPQILSL